MRITIDLWGTLIQGSPLFNQNKVELVKNTFGTVDSDKINSAFTNTKRYFNNVIENSGLHFNRIDIFSAFHFNLYGTYPSYKQLLYFINEYDKLALEYYPHVIDHENTHESLKKLSEIGELILSSNTFMLNSNTLIENLDNLYLKEYFKEFLFSDVLGHSKPHIDMFAGSNYHIGDNQITDGVGALNAGSIPIIINSNSKTLEDAYLFIIESEGIQ